MNYMETKQKLNELRRFDEVLFRMAISHLMDVGIRHLNEENVEHTCAEIMKEDDSHSFMPNFYKCKLIKTAAEIAKLSHTHVLTYISREMYYDVGDDALSYDRAIRLLSRCMDQLYENHGDCRYTLNELRDIGFEDDEIEVLGCGYLLDLKEEEEDE